MYDFTYVGNVAHAHICAERALASEGEVAEKAAGQVHLSLFFSYTFCFSTSTFSRERKSLKIV